ncbi:hypothetical protein ACER0C_001744 [Sarotherodon galilaeus]
MFPQYGQLILKPQLCSLYFHHAVILLLLIDRTGQSETVTPSQTIITLVGEDVILPCHLEPPSDAVSETLEWGRPDLDPRFVHVWYKGQNHLVNQNPSYKGRTSLSTEKLKQGDLSLKLSRVKPSDNGRYRCFFLSQHKESIIELLVGSLSLPTISGININNSRVVLQCESAGWYPEPELLWLDGEGNLLSAGPTETLRGPDDLYTVSSRVTVEKRHKNSFTCRVQQRDMKQSRETHIHVSGDCVAVPHFPADRVSIILAICLILTAAAISVWKWKQNRSKERKRQKVEELLMAESKKSEELQKKDEELKDLEELINILMKQQIELKEVKDKLGDQSNTFASEVENLGEQFLEVDKNTEKDRAKGYKDLKSIIIKSKNRLPQQRLAYGEMETNIERLLISTQQACNKMRNIKTEAEKQKENIILQLSEIQKQNETIHKKSNLESNQETLNI